MDWSDFFVWWETCWHLWDFWDSCICYWKEAVNQIQGVKYCTQTFCRDACLLEYNDKSKQNIKASDLCISGWLLNSLSNNGCDRLDNFHFSSCWGLYSFPPYVSLTFSWFPQEPKPASSDHSHDLPSVSDDWQRCYFDWKNVSFDWLDNLDCCFYWRYWRLPPFSRVQYWDLKPSTFSDFSIGPHSPCLQIFCSDIYLCLWIPFLLFVSCKPHILMKLWIFEHYCIDFQNLLVVQILSLEICLSVGF